MKKARANKKLESRPSVRRCALYTPVQFDGTETLEQHQPLAPALAVSALRASGLHLDMPGSVELRAVQGLPTGRNHPARRPIGIVPEGILPDRD